MFFISYLLFLSSTLCSVWGIDNAKCYETLESIQVRWSIRNYHTRKEKINEAIVSPIFPTDVTSQTKWRLALYPRGTSVSDGDVAILLCVTSFTRSAELVSFTTHLLSDGSFTNLTSVHPTQLQYFPQQQSGERCNGDYVTVDEVSTKVTSLGSLDFVVLFDRLRKLPECLEPTESDLGRGGLAELQSPPPIRAYYCTTKTDFISDVTYTWNGELPLNLEDGIQLESTVFPAQGDSKQWQLALVKKKASKFIGVYLKLVSKVTVAASFTVTIQGSTADGDEVQYHESFGVHEFKESTNSNGIDELLQFDIAKDKYFIGNKFNISVRINIAEYHRESCEATCPLHGLLPTTIDIGSSNVMTSATSGSTSGGPSSSGGTNSGFQLGSLSPSSCEDFQLLRKEFSVYSKESQCQESLLMTRNQIKILEGKIQGLENVIQNSIDKGDCPSRK